MSLSFTGWTPSVFRRSASVLGHGPASGGSVQPNDPANAAANLMAGNTGGSPTGDAGLHSRQYMNPLTGNREVAAASSVYGNPNVPAYLADAVNGLNLEQLQRRIQLTNFQNELFKRYDQGGDNAYLTEESLRAMAVQPGSHVTFGQAVQNPNIGLGYLTQSNAQARNTDARTGILATSNNNQIQLQQLQTQRAQLASMGQPTYQLDNQILNLQNTPNPTATAVGGANPRSGWVPTPVF